MKTLRAAVIGHIAKQVLQRNTSFQMAGSTSQGIFLQPPGDFTLFATTGHFRGPLTLNIKGETENFPEVLAASNITLAAERMVVEGSGLAISFQKSAVWEPPEPPDDTGLAKTQFELMVQQTASILPDHPYSTLLEFAVGFGPASLKGIPGLEHRLSSLSSSLDQGKSSPILAGMKAVLGAGPGLTPLGDDLLLGILLAFSCSKNRTFDWQDKLDIPQKLLVTAREKTTTLSWSLLSCSAQGSADERIIRVLNGLLGGREIPDQDLRNLLEWGSSSGIGVLAGMILALSRRDQVL